jgi:hypothetical protein
MLFFARAAGAAREDQSARAASIARLAPYQVEGWLATWSRELDRAP